MVAIFTGGPCKEGQFACSPSGPCIDDEFFCDSLVHCNDTMLDELGNECESNRGGKGGRPPISCKKKKIKREVEN